MGVSRARGVVLAGFLALMLAVGAESAVAKPLPNLKPTKLSNPPATAAPGDSLTVTETVKNAGDKPAPASTSRAYLSLDQKKSAGDKRLSGVVAIRKLKPGAAAVGSSQLDIPAALGSGHYFLIGCADDKGKVRESNEKDNCRSSKHKVSVGPTPTTPYAINQGTVAPGTLVSLSSLAVTAVGSGGVFWVAIQSTDPAYAGVNFSGLEVHTSSPPSLQSADRVDLVGISHTPGPSSPGLTASTVTVTGSGAIDLPHALTLTEISTHPLALNAVPVEAQNVTLSSHSGGNWLMSEGFTVGNGIVGALPALSDGAPITAVDGIANTTGSTLVVSPRDAGDISAPPSLLSFTNAPSQPCVHSVGSTATPIGTVNLSSPASGDTVVTVQSSNSSVVSVNGGPGGGITVPNGQTSAVVNGDIVSAGTVTLTAQLGTIQKSIQFEVRGPADPVALAGLSLSAATVHPGQDVTGTVTLDCDATSGGVMVTLSSDSAHVTVPPNVTVPAGQTSATFLAHGVSSGGATISATLGPVTKQKTLTVN